MTPGRLTPLILMGVALVLAAIGFVSWNRWRAEDRARRGLSAFGALVEANRSFYWNDLDGNGIRDYWTADIYGLYGLIPVGKDGKTIRQEPLRLISEEIAVADGASQRALYPHQTPSLDGSLYHGSVFVGLRGSIGSSGRHLLAQDTDGPGYLGPVHCTEDYAIFWAMAAPPPGYGKVLIRVEGKCLGWSVNQRTLTMIFQGMTPKNDSTIQFGGSAAWPELQSDLMLPDDPSARGFSTVD